MWVRKDDAFQGTFEAALDPQEDLGVVCALGMRSDRGRGFMEFKDYYAALGVERAATQDEIKRAYRKLARKYHPDVSKEADAEARFKEVAEAYEALNDPEKRAAYDDVGRRYRDGQDFKPPPGWDSGFEFSGRDFGPAEGTDFSDFFEALFGRHASGARARGTTHAAGGDHHAKILIDLRDAYRGARRTISLRVPVLEAQGHVTLQERQLDVNIPKGVHEGQHLRLAGQGGPGHGGAQAGDLYLEISFRPHPHFRVDSRDVYLDLPIAPWEAALGTVVTAPTPDGGVQLTIPPGSSSGRKLRLKGKGLPGKTPGDLYAVLNITAPPAESPAAKDAYAALARAFPGFNPRSALEA
jgi:curved DNA-binding protein